MKKQIANMTTKNAKITGNFVLKIINIPIDVAIRLIQKYQKIYYGNITEEIKKSI
jgi:hypothetical protein